MLAREAASSGTAIRDAAAATVARKVAAAPVTGLAAPAAAAGVLALQRRAGNRAAAQVVRQPSSAVARLGRRPREEREPDPRPTTGRVLARCQGRCTCGGSCRGQDDELELAGSLRRAVLARRSADGARAAPDRG